MDHGKQLTPSGGSTSGTNMALYLILAMIGHRLPLRKPAKLNLKVRMEFEDVGIPGKDKSLNKRLPKRSLGLIEQI